MSLTTSINAFKSLTNNDILNFRLSILKVSNSPHKNEIKILILSFFSNNKRRDYISGTYIAVSLLNSQEIPSGS